jgi:hypothetical protein
MEARTLVLTRGRMDLDMSDRSRERELRELFDRLGESVRGAMLEDPRIRRELQALRAAGWEPAIRFEARLTAEDRSEIGASGERDLSFSVSPSAAPEQFQLDAGDVSWLREIGITAGRYRSPVGFRRASGNAR